MNSRWLKLKWPNQSWLKKFGPKQIELEPTQTLTSGISDEIGEMVGIHEIIAISDIENVSQCH